MFKIVENLKKDLEQLNTANNLLEMESDTGARLALILLDNLTEILMYRFAISKFAEDDVYNQFSKLQFSAKERKSVLNHFEDKIKFLKKLDIINDDIVIILRIIHNIRNEAYHLDILKKNVLFHIVKTYNQIVCQLFLDLSETGYGSTDLVPFLKKHGISGMFLSYEILEKLISKNSEFDNDHQIDDLFRVLSDDLIQRIDSIKYDIDYLINGSNFDDEDDLLKNLQFWEKGISEEKTDWDEINRLLDEFKPNIKFGTLDKWKIRSKTILKTTNRARALQIWSEIDSELSKLEIMLIAAVGSYEAHVSLMIDEALMK